MTRKRLWPAEWSQFFFFRPVTSTFTARAKSSKNRRSSKLWMYFHRIWKIGEFLAILAAAPDHM